MQILPSGAYCARRHATMENVTVNHVPTIPTILSGECLKIDYSRKQLSRKLQKQAEVELNEDPHRVDEDLNKLRNYVKSWSLNCSTDSRFLLMFLRARKFNVERAAKLLKNYLKIRQYKAELFNTPIWEMHNVLKQDIHTILPSRDQRGSAVMILCAGLWNPNGCTLDHLYRFAVGCLEMLVQDPETQINGIVIIIDMGHLCLTQIRHFSPSYIRKLAWLVQDAFPARFKGIHIVNEPLIFNVLFAMTWPFLSEKIRSRFFCHGANLSSLHDHIEPDILPVKYGGKKTNMGISN